MTLLFFFELQVKLKSKNNKKVQNFLGKSTLIAFLPSAGGGELRPVGAVSMKRPAAGG